MVQVYAIRLWDEFTGQIFGPILRVRFTGRVFWLSFRAEFTGHAFGPSIFVMFTTLSYMMSFVSTFHPIFQIIFTNRVLQVE